MLLLRGVSLNETCCYSVDNMAFQKERKGRDRDGIVRAFVLTLGKGGFIGRNVHVVQPWACKYKAGLSCNGVTSCES